MASGASTLASGLASAQQQTAALPSQTQQLNSGAQRVAAGNRQLADDGPTRTAPTSMSLRPARRRDACISGITDNLPEGVELTEEQQAALQATVTDAVTRVNTAGASAKTHPRNDEVRRCDKLR